MSPETAPEVKREIELHTAVAVLGAKMEALSKSVDDKLSAVERRVQETQTSQHEMVRQISGMQTSVAADMKSFQVLVDAKIGEIDKKFDAKVERVIWAVAKAGGTIAVIIALLIFILNKWPFVIK